MTGLDVWSVDVRVAACRERQLGDLLSDAERDRADGFASRADALRYRVAHGALRSILGGRTGIAPRAIRFSHGDRGKPSLAGGGIRFNLSHSGMLALVAVADRDVGVDVEEVRAVPAAAAIARGVVADLRPGGRDARFMRLWTALEAIVKAEGTGMTDGFDRFEIREGGDDRAQAWIQGAPEPMWSVRWLAPAPGHVGAVALRGDDFAVRLRRFA